MKGFPNKFDDVYAFPTVLGIFDFYVDYQNNENVNLSIYQKDKKEIDSFPSVINNPIFKNLDINTDSETSDDKSYTNNFITSNFDKKIGGTEKFDKN